MSHLGLVRMPSVVFRYSDNAAGEMAHVLMWARCRHEVQLRLHHGFARPQEGQRRGRRREGCRYRERHPA